MQEDNLSDITLTPRIPTAEENPFIPMAQKMAQPDQLGLNAPEDNPFLAIAKGMGGEGQPPAIGSIASTLSINPDQAAQASKLGGQFGLGQDIALRNMDELRRRSLITRLQQTGMLDKNPALAESLANPAFSAQAHDDIDNLAETGSWIDSISKGFEGGFLMQEMGELRFSPLSGERFYGATAAQQERIEQVRKRMQETQGSGVLYMTAQVIAQQLAQAKGIGTLALTGFGIGGATFGAPGAVAGGGVAAATGVVLTTAQMEAGLLYDELEQAGVDPETATTAAVIGGVINGAIELAGFKIAAAPFRPLLRKLIADRVGALAMPTMRTAAKGFAKGYATQVGTETLEETVQEITAMTASEIAKAADGIDSELTWTDALTRITDAAVGGFQGSLLLGGIGPGANAIVDVRRAKQTEAQQKWLDGLQERVEASKVRERNPNAFQEFVEKQVEGKPVATIYVDAEEAKGVLAQLNLTVSQVDAIVPGFAEQVRVESERGGDVTIPTAVFSAKLANTDLGNALRPHMRLSPEALSVTQLEAVRAERERMSAAGQDVIDERLAAEDNEFVDSATRVEQTMYEELTAAGQPATEAKINAEFVRNMMASLADRVGVTPEQMFERYPYRVRGEGQAEQAQALEQAVQPETLAMLTDEEVEQLADYAYDVGATQEDIDLIETEVDRRFREEDDPAGEPDTTTGIGIEELLRDEAKRARQDGLSNAQLGEYIRNNAEFEIITQAAVQKGITDEQLGAEAYAALDAQEARVQAIKDRIARRKQQRPLTQASRIDADYMAAVERGDMEAAQRMVDEAARATGYDIPVEHQTQELFNEFRAGEFGFHVGTGIPPGMLGQITMKLRARISNPLRMKDLGVWSAERVVYSLPERIITDKQRAQLLDEVPEEMRTGSPESGDMFAYYEALAPIREFLKNAGYDGIVYRNEGEGFNDSYIAFDAEQLKSADPVTYDEAGNVIPLSRRFNITSPMIFEQAAVQRAEPATLERLQMQAQRGVRRQARKVELSLAEEKAIETAAIDFGESAAEIREAVLNHKKAHPTTQGWAPLEFVKLVPKKIEDKGKKGLGLEKLDLQYQQIPYGFHRDASGAPLQPNTPEYQVAVTSVARRMVDEVRAVAKRAAAGDLNAVRIINQSTWYKAMRTALRREFGGLGDLFADLLGATSPNTPVRGNWDFALDVLRRAVRGDFDQLITKWEAWVETVERLETDLRAYINDEKRAMEARGEKVTQAAIQRKPEYIKKFKALKEARELPDELLPRQENGKKYGFNGGNVVRAMVGLWRTVREQNTLLGTGAQAPKALNFSGNLIGFRSRATIDVWAARMLQRLAALLRIPSMAETGVAGDMLPDGSTTGQFGFGQDVFAEAAQRIRTDPELNQNAQLAQLNDDDLQALVWFIEKELWTINNWTSVAGEGGSFELEASLAGISDREMVTKLRKTIDAGVPTKIRQAASRLPAAQQAKLNWYLDPAKAGWRQRIEALRAELDAIPTTLTKKAQRELRTAISERLDAALKKSGFAKLEQALEDAIAADMKIAAIEEARKAAQAQLIAMERRVDRYTAGLSQQQSLDSQGVDYVPTDADQARLADNVRLRGYRADRGELLVAIKSMPTEGRYGSIERSIDLEVIARQGWSPDELWKVMLEEAKDARQESTFLSRVLRADEAIDATRHRPGLEIYFRSPIPRNKLDALIAKLNANGVDFFTVIVDARRSTKAQAGAMADAVGIRMQYVPEFMQRYGIEDFSGLSEAEIADRVMAKEAEWLLLADQVMRIMPEVSFAGVFWHETRVAFADSYESEIDAITTGTATADGGLSVGTQWTGQSVSDGLAAANRFVESRAAQAEPDGGGQVLGGVQEGDRVGLAQPGVGTVFEQAARIFEQRPVTPGFYSALEREVVAIDAKALTADGWKQRLQGLVNKGAVKADEIEWSGLNDWIAMQEGKVSKDTVLEFLRGNGVKVEVRTLGDRTKTVNQAAIDGSFVAEENLREYHDGLSVEVENAFDTYRTLIETGASREAIAQQSLIINDALDGAFGTDLDYYIESEYEDRSETKYAEYALPGGTNYREVLLYLPQSPSVRASQQQRYRDMVEAGVPLIEAQELATMSADDVQQRIFDLQRENEPHAKRVEDFARFVAPKVEGQTPFGLYQWFLDHQIEDQWRGKVDQLMGVLNDEERQWVTNRGYLQSLEKFQAINWQIMSWQAVSREMAYQARGYQSPHWNETNVLVHLRLTDRIDADGNRVLFVEEVQSDWGQAGVKRGFFNQRAADMAELDNLVAQQEVNPTDARKKQIARVRNRIYKNEYNVIRGPYVETTEGWLNLGLKQIMLEAVTGNYDRVAFVNGEQSAERYDLSKRVGRIEYGKIKNQYRITIYDIDGRGIDTDKDLYTANELEDVVGKEVAQKIVDGSAASEDGRGVISGIDLKVGGEGMQDFYDKIVPAAMNKLLKKYGGGKLSITTISQTQEDEQNAYAGQFQFRTEQSVDDFLTDISIAGLDGYDYGRDDTGNVVSFRLPGNIYEKFKELAENRNALPIETPELITGEEFEKPELETTQSEQPAFDITPAMVEKLATGLPLFQAARGLARGGFDPQKLLTTLNKDADFSTFAHETAHYFLTILGDVAARPDAPASVLDDMNTLLRWFGVKDLATWNSMSLDQQRQYHEQFAYSFETYLFEGKAPSVEMQGLFDQFARWLKQVYQGLITKINDVYKAEFGKDLPILTGEVRQVMDRMLATEDQIARAQAIREMKPQFQTQEQSGMDDAAWAAYQELQEQATERAVAELTTATLKEMAWMSRARGRKLRELQRQHDDKRKEIKDEVTEDLRILPVYRAMEFLKRGKVVDVDGTTKPATGQFKLSLAGVQAVMPPGFDVATLGRGRYGMVNEDGLHPDLIAPLYGYASGAELVTALSTAKPFAEAVAERTDQRMLSEFSELADPAARSLAVDRAIHNEARARLIAVEQRWAAKLQQPVSVIMEAASQVAGEIIGRQAIRTLSPRAYAAAEARAARLATSAYTEPQSPEQAGQTAATRAYNAAIAAGRTVDEATAESLSAGVAAVDTARQRRAEFDAKYGGKTPAEVVMRAKRQQLLQNMLARQALEARAEIDRARSAFKRFFGSDEKIGKTRNMELVSAARAILGWYGFGKRGKSPAEYVDQLKAYNPAAYAQLEPLILRATQGPQDYRDLTVDEFRVLRDTVDGLWIQARKDKQVKLADRTMALDEVVGELDQRLEEIGVPKVVAGEKRAPTFRDRAARNLMILRATMRRVEAWADSMDGVSKNRPFTTYLVRPVLDAVDKFTASRNKYMKRFRDLVVNLQMPEGTIAAPELDYTFGSGNAGIGKAELLGALLHTGNASNYRKLLLGRGWGQEDEFGNLDDTQFKAFVKRMQDDGVLTKADYDFLQAVWDLNEEIKPIAQKAHYELYGFYFTEIPATEVVTPFGTYRGGYVPAAADKFMVTDAAQRAGEEELESDWRNSLPSTGRGFTKARVAGYNKALSLDVRVIGAHIDAALRFSMIQPAITQALRILRSREFAARLDRVDPTVKQELLIPWLNRTARQLVSQPGKYRAVDAFWRGVRTRTGMSIMFANLRNALQQFTGLFPAGLKVQPRYLTAALTEYVGSPQRTANSVAALSPFMEDRLKGQSFEVQEQINEVLLNPSRFDRAQAWTDRHGYFLQQAFQNMVDVVTWVGAYNQSLSTTDTTVTAEEAQREAIAAGDAAVRLTQGSVRPSDVSAFESGTPFFRTLTQFAGYFNMLANLNATEYVKVIRDMGFRGNKGKLVYIYMMGFMLPAVVADAIVRSLGGGWEDEDEDGYLDTFMDWFFGSQIRQGVAFVPFGTTAYTLATTAFDDKPYNDRMTTSPSVASLEAATVGVGKAAIAVVDEEKDVTGKNVRDVLTLLSLATGIPFSVLGRPAGYLVDVQRGEVEPTSTYDMIRGTITGTATPESKR